MFSVRQRLLEAYQKAKVIPFDEQSRFILLSDCHRGQGNSGDNFLPNQEIYCGALEYYYKNGFTYIELGDGDELWENRCARPIIQTHVRAFEILSRFYREGRLHMLFGNHDMVKRRREYKAQCASYTCDCDRCEKPLFPGLEISESLVLENRNTGQRLLLVHGHQGSVLNDALWPLARFLVRYIWGPLELVGFLAPVGGGRLRENTEKIEKELCAFASSENRIVIAGHTHRPIFPKPGECPYFNDGSCVHPHCITGIEIDGGRIALVRWAVDTREDRSLFIQREVLGGPAPLEAYTL